MTILNILDYSSITGVGTFTYTLLEAIKSKYKAIKIDVWCRSIIKESLLLDQLKMVCDNIYFDIPNKKYDLVFTHQDQDIIPDAKKVYHFVHNLSSDNYLNTSADKVFCFGERSFNYIDHSNKELIRNAINLKRFKYEPTNSLDKVLLIDSRNNAFINSKVLAACSTSKKYFSFVGEDSNHNIPNRWFVEDFIKPSDIVLGVGRSAIESLAMGKNVIILNVNQLNGIVTLDNFWKHAETNFSGWTEFRKDDYSVIDLIKVFRKLDKKGHYEIRNIIEEHYDIEKYLEKILN